MASNILITLAITYLISQSKITQGIREWIANKHWILAELIYCKVCLSFWIGLYLTYNVKEALVIMGVFALINIYENKI